MSLLRPILGWLRAGYPDGVPSEDYIALLGVLQRHLTESEIVLLVQQLRERAGREPLSHDHIRAAAREVLRGQASEEDVRRVCAHLAAGGWPLSDTPTGDQQDHGRRREQSAHSEQPKPPRPAQGLSEDRTTACDCVDDDTTTTRPRSTA